MFKKNEKINFKKNAIEVLNFARSSWQLLFFKMKSIQSPCKYWRACWWMALVIALRFQWRPGSWKKSQSIGRGEWLKATLMILRSISKSTWQIWRRPSRWTVNSDAEYLIISSHMEFNISTWAQNRIAERHMNQTRPFVNSQLKLGCYLASFCL